MDSWKPPGQQSKLYGHVWLDKPFFGGFSQACLSCGLSWGETPGTGGGPTESAVTDATDNSSSERGGRGTPSCSCGQRIAAFAKHIKRYTDLLEEQWTITPSQILELTTPGFDCTTSEGRVAFERLTHGVFHAKDYLPTVEELLLSHSSHLKHQAPPKMTRDLEYQEWFDNPSPPPYWRNRRLKMSNLLKFYKRELNLLQPMKGADYQLALNIMIWSQALTDTEFQALETCNFITTRDQFSEVAAKISADVKPIGLESRTKRLFGEFDACLGYKHEDSEWDTDAEMVKLSAVDPPRVDNWEQLWEEAANKVFIKPAIMPKYQEFSEYVKSLRWATSGSSSVGRVYYIDEHKALRHFKPRKNMVTALLTPEQIWTLVQNWDGRIVNTPVIKNELGKIRLAIASNLESYIYEAYCLDMFGHSFKNWGGITLDETVTEEVERTQLDIENLRKSEFALPWDFAKFDHQVRKTEIQDILTRLKSYCDKRTWQVWDMVIGSYDKAVLTNPQTGYSVAVTNGLQSGQRTTSLIGNTWNAICTQIARQKANHLMGKEEHVRIGIRGDDTYILSKNPKYLYLLRLSFASLMIVGHDRKFSIRQWSFEFLRNTTTTESVIGWPSRAIPAITERKPWSDDLLTPHTEVVTISENIRNFERRIQNELPHLHMSNKVQWSRFTKQSYLWLELPRRLGGLGIYQFRGFIPSSKLSLTPEYAPKIDNDFSDWAPSYMGLTPAEARIYNSHRFTQMLRPSDVRGGLRIIFDSFRSKVAAMTKKNITWRRNETPLPAITTYLTHQPPNMEFDLPRINLSSPTPGWPRFNEFLSHYQAYRKTKKEENISLTNIAKQHYPSVYSWLMTYQVYGWHRADAIDMILGDLPSESVWPSNNKTKKLSLGMVATDVTRPR